MKTVSNGVFATPRTGSSTPPGDAAAAPSGPTISAKGGISTLGKIKETTEDETATLIKTKLGIPLATVSFDVMDVPGDVEREEGYWNVKRGERTIIQFLRTMSGPDEAGPLATIVWSSDVETDAGIKVGDTVGRLNARFADLSCEPARIADLIPADVVCRSAGEKELGYIVNANVKNVNGKTSPAKIKDAVIMGISHEF